jgi:A/G-specific adenine glycosylase
MLQQTTVAAVTPRFERFVARWPTVHALASAPEADVLGEWAGLGYYARARNLIACAREVAARGGFPSNSAELGRLPGIGDYTSAAIAAIAFGERTVPVDTNVERVIARLHALRQPRRGQVAQLAAEMLPAGHPGDFAQALMDLGATICRPRAPDCPACPLASDCAARVSGTPEGFPERRVRPQRTQLHGLASWTEESGKLWLVRRSPRGLLGGMAALPGSEWTAAPISPRPETIGTVRHVFTHASLDLTIVRGGGTDEEGWWQPISELEHAGLPTLYRRAAEMVLSGGECKAQPLEVALASP